MMRTTIVVALFASMASSGCRHSYEHWTPYVDAKDVAQVIKDEQESLAKLRARKGMDSSPAYARVAEFIKRWEPLKKGADPEAWLRAAQDHVFRIKASPTGDDLKAAQRNDVASSQWQKTVATLNKARLDAFYGQEYKAISEANENRKYHSRIGLALSGGGLRSASFSTGVLQGLHEIGVLDDIGYMSTVSGGGWAGYWYMCHDESPETLFTPGSRHLDRLGERGHFLSGLNYTKSKTELVAKVGLHVLTLPFHWLLNGFLDCDQDVLWARKFFREAIHDTFSYKSATGNAGESQTPRPMAYFKPHAGKRSGKPELGAENYKWTKPFWVVNMHLALQDEKNAHRNRSGDAFEITPLRAGADAAGYVRVPKNPSGSTSWMYADTAVAISSAAVDSRSDQSGLLVNALTQALNFDQGYYVDSWHFHWTGSRSFWHYVQFWLFSPYPLYGLLGALPWVDEVVGNDLHTENLHAKRYHLTDGAHFDNTGIYSLIRRGCRLIIVSDATGDSGVNNWDWAGNKERAKAFADFRELQKLVLADFGAEISVEWKDFEVADKRNPSRFIETPHTKILVGTIKDLPILDKSGNVDPDVKILYIKSAYNINEQLINKNSFVDLEKAHNPDFSQDSTARVAYSERQVLSYRELARQIIRRGRKAFQDAVENVKRRH